jgi:hypothetical protein
MSKIKISWGLLNGLFYPPLKTEHIEQFKW